jgi:hypothetical protein
MGQFYFDLPAPYDTATVVGNYNAAAADPGGLTPSGQAARTWLDTNHFGAVVGPILMTYLHMKEVPGAEDFFSLLSYDALHDFFLGESAGSGCQCCHFNLKACSHPNSVRHGCFCRYSHSLHGHHRFNHKKQSQEKGRRE